MMNNFEREAQFQTQHKFEREAQFQDQEFGIENPRSGRIGGSLGTLDYEINALQDVFAKLQDALAPVLTPDQPIPEKVAKMEMTEPTQRFSASPIAVDIMHHSERLKTLRLRMEETLGMVDLF